MNSSFDSKGTGYNTYMDLSGTYSVFSSYFYHWHSVSEAMFKGVGCSLGRTLFQKEIKEIDEKELKQNLNGLHPIAFT